jgi:uncharacterized protein DUF1440
MRTPGSRSLPVDLVLGAAAGAGSTWLMDRATTKLYASEPAAVKKAENAARGDQTAYERAADKAAHLFHRKLSKSRRKQLGNALHWALGASAGALYGALRHYYPRLRLGTGLAYGVAFWLAADEAALTALDVTPPPQAFPWQTHARGLLGHLVLGGGIEAVFDAADSLAA